MTFLRQTFVFRRVCCNRSWTQKIPFSASLFYSFAFLLPCSLDFTNLLVNFYLLFFLFIFSYSVKPKSIDFISVLFQSPLFSCSILLLTSKNFFCRTFQFHQLPFRQNTKKLYSNIPDAAIFFTASIAVS